MRPKETLRINEVKSYLLPFETLPRPVYWFNDTFESGTWSDRHQHDDWGELVYMGSGRMVICTQEGNFLVPPQRAVWIPPGMPHEWYLPDTANDRSLFIAPQMLPLGEGFLRPRILMISPLVRELILALETVPYPYDDGRDQRLVLTLIDQLAALPEVPFALPLPSNRRLLELCTAILNMPGTPKTLRQWSVELGMSERNLARQFLHETGMSFGRWRQHIRLQHAVERLECGEKVTTVALDCGYMSVSAFIVAFKRLHKTTPRKMIARSADL